MINLIISPAHSEKNHVEYNGDNYGNIKSTPLMKKENIYIPIQNKNLIDIEGDNQNMLSEEKKVELLELKNKIIDICPACATGGLIGIGGTAGSFDGNQVIISPFIRGSIEPDLFPTESIGNDEIVIKKTEFQELKEKAIIYDELFQ